MMKRRILSGFFALLSILSAFFLWRQTVSLTVDFAGTSELFVPAIYATVFFVSFALFLLLAKREIVIVSISAICLFSILLVSFSFSLAVAAGAATMIFVISARAVRRDLQERLKIKPRKSLHEGFAWLILAVSMLTSVLYYNLLVERESATLALNSVLRGTISGGMVAAIMPSPLTDEFSAEQNLAVDDFIEYFVRRQMQKGGDDLTGDEISFKFLEDYAGAVKDRIDRSVAVALPLKKNDNSNVSVSYAETKVPPEVVVAVRRKLSQELGREVAGDESAEAVFADLLQKQFQRYAEEHFLPSGYEFSSALAAVMALLLFVSLWWIGFWAGMIWVWLSDVLFRLLRYLGLIRVTEVQAVREQMI